MKNNDPKKCYYCKNFYLTTTDIPGEFKCKNRTNCTKEVESCESFELKGHDELYCEIKKED